MLLNNFKVAGFKAFGETVELKMNEGERNTTYLKENLIETKINKFVYKNLKSSVVYGSNNTGKSSLLDAIMIMKQVFLKGDNINFPFDKLKNFTFDYENIIRFEIDFIDKDSNYIYGIEFENSESIGEYLIIDDILIFSRGLDGLIEGKYINNLHFKNTVDSLTTNKLIVPYFLGYQKDLTEYSSFVKVQDFFNKIYFVDNRRNDFSIDTITSFMQDKRKAKVLNKLIKSTELYLEGRIVIDDLELIKSGILNEFLEETSFETSNKLNEDKDKIQPLVELLKITSIYKGRDGELLQKPSVLFDSIGTNKYLNISMLVINAIIDKHILLIDEFDSSLHHKLTRILVILMNSEANKESQFIMTTHDVKLLNNKLFRKDQINFIERTNDGVEIISLNDFKSNSDNDVRNTSNFEKMYIEEKITPLPLTNIHSVIKEIIDNE